MSRPIPEGVELPHPNAVILGWGKGFKVPEEGFEGYAIWPGNYPDWNEGHKQGDDDRLIYAADRDSDVARLNRSSAAPREGETLSTETRQTADVQAKDALIRELVKGLGQIASGIKAPSGRAVQAGWNQPLEAHDMQRMADELITLARTTCPEAFDGGNENSTS